MMPNKIRKYRRKAYQQQHGLCFYCGKPMWLDDLHAFANRYAITISQAKQFRCTAEHLIAKQDGGKNSQTNIAAACIFCNRLRHARKMPLAPLEYKKIVLKRLRKSGWNAFVPLSQNCVSPQTYASWMV